MSNNKHNDTFPLLQEYLNYQITVKGKSKLTVEQYKLDLIMFFKFLVKIKTDLPNEYQEIDISSVDVGFINGISYSDILEFLTYTAVERNNQAAARARKCSAIRGFFGYMQKRSIITVNPTKDLETPKLKKSLPKYLTLDDSISLLESVDGKNKERDYCIITLFLNCGMRLSELVGINISSIKDNNITVTGKGNKQRSIFLNDMCINAIDQYLQVRPKDGVVDRDALFLSRLRKRISPKTVQWIIYKFLEKAGLQGQNLSVHKLRHTAATLMYQNGVDVRVLQDILGHESLNTTQIYTHIRDEQVEAAIKLNPIAKASIKKK